MKKSTVLSRQLGQRLKNAREQAGITQAAAAKKIAVDPSQLCHWEWGHYEPRLKVLIALANLYEVTLASLADLSEGV